MANEPTAAPLKIFESGRGYFIGNLDEGPDRKSFQYWRTEQAAEQALASGAWTPRDPVSSSFEWGDTKENKARLDRMVAEGEGMPPQSLQALELTDKKRALDEIANGLGAAGGNGQQNKEQDRER